MSTATVTQTQVLKPKPPVLDQRFAVLKQSLVKPEHKQKVIESYARLQRALAAEVDLISKNGPAMVPEIDFNDVMQNDGTLPPAFATLVRDRGCVILRNVVPTAQASAWEASLKSYTARHRSVGGFPVDNPQNWSLWWTPPQVQIRSHPRVLAAMRCVSQLWHVDDGALPIDMDAQVVYPDRFRIRYPSTDAEYTLPAHLDSGGIERWECAANRENFAKIFQGEWEGWDGWKADARLEARSDLYGVNAACSCWRCMQGWLSLSETGTGEGTLRLLPSLKASVAYIMLRPLFDDEGGWSDGEATFPGSEPGNTQFFPSKEWHAALQMEKSIVGIPPSLLRVREAFKKAAVPPDFALYEIVKEHEGQHEDHGARRDNILSSEGLQAMGLEPYDVDAPGLTEGQRKMRKMANEALGFGTAAEDD
ncbi:uncharacterized protein LTHEOB_6475 [Lasiodiplodia theobromae]|uniref:uncharacterized protein n=1 Tax=Lasiodiplodia theobromae TaxID=45133 RepID=UPI0015C32464|nr:uncharacterized protein LTHEOB_6475 [Lasiodiplodia theobromae]KAF4544357.1 hypothetical protein LTHEOB_6475 [Lasiodiplodia theobromae]